MTALPVPHLDTLSTVPPGLLYPHQADGVAFLISKKRAILADDMGLGKTRQAIVALEVAERKGMVLVVCPASLKLNWKREILIIFLDWRNYGKKAVGERSLAFHTCARGLTKTRYYSFGSAARVGGQSCYLLPKCSANGQRVGIEICFLDQKGNTNRGWRFRDSP